MASKDTKNGKKKEKESILTAGPGAVLDAAGWIVRQAALPIPELPKWKKKDKDAKKK